MSNLTENGKIKKAKPQARIIVNGKICGKLTKPKTNKNGKM